jgi:hypothetical protein
MFLKEVLTLKRRNDNIFLGIVMSSVRMEYCGRKFGLGGMKILPLTRFEYTICESQTMK